MAVNFIQLGERIKDFRGKANLSQEELANMLNLSSEYIAFLESGVRAPKLDTLVDLANALKVSADDLLVDSLDYSVSTADSKVHLLLLECNDIEEKIILQLIVELKEILYRFGI